MPTTAFINGIPLIASGPNMWGASVGVSPFRGTFDCALSDLGNLLSIPRNKAELTVNRGDGSVTWKQLSVLRSTASEDQHIGRVTLVDKRHWWRYAYHFQFVNWRRRIGTSRKGQQQELIQPAKVDKIAYAKFSTADGQGKAWTPIDLLNYVFRAVDGAEPAIQDSQLFRGVPLENLDIDHNGQEAIARVLRALPGAEVTIDPDGTARVFSWISGEEREMVGTGEIAVFGQAGPEIVGQGHVELIDNANERPEYIDVLFTPEVEVRFDFIGEDPKPVDGSLDPFGTVTRRHLANVGPSVDFELTDPDNAQDKVYPGTYKTIDWFLDAWGATAPEGALLSRLTKEAINKAMIPERNLFTMYNLLGLVDPKGAQQDWQSRLAMLQQHYRVTYQLPKDWVDRTLDIRPYMVSTLDIASGQRGPALVYGDHSFRFSDKGLYTQGSAKRRAWAKNVNGYPGENVDPDSGDPVTPLRVSVVDPDQGVIHLDPNLDPYKGQDQILPSQIDNMPTGNRRKSNAGPIYFHSIKKVNGTVPKLSSTQQTAVYLTLVPATALYRIRIKPGDVTQLLPPAARDSLRSSIGPPMSVRVGPGIETARIAWSQRARQPIEDLFFASGIGQPPKPATLEALRVHCVNDRPGGAQNNPGEFGASLINIARSKAAAIYATMHDRVVGNMTGIYGDMAPRGAVESVTHSLNADGAILSSYQMRGDFDELDIVAYMDPSTFRIVRRLAQ